MKHVHHQPYYVVLHKDGSGRVLSPARGGWDTIINRKHLFVSLKSATENARIYDGDVADAEVVITVKEKKNEQT